MPTAVAPSRRPGRAALRPAAASALAPAWLHGPPAPAKVVAVLDRAAYLLRDDEVLPVLAPGALVLPGALRVPVHGDLDDLRLRVGAEVQVGHGRLHAADGGLEVRRTWAPRPVPSEVLPPASRVLARAGLDPLLPRAAGRGTAGGQAADPPRKAAVFDSGLADGADLGRLWPAALLAASAATAPVGAGRLLGLGPGLTPAGDDVLCGVLLGLRATGRDGDHAQLAGALPPLLGRTTALSATLLRQAALGYAVPPVVALVDAWHRGPDRAHLVELGTGVASVGHTSGAALLLGLAAALAPMAGADERRRGPVPGGLS